MPGERERAAIAVAIYRYLDSNPAPKQRWRNNPQSPPSEHFEPSLELRLQPAGVDRFEVTLGDGEDQRVATVIVHTRDEAGMAFELDGHLMRVYVSRGWAWGVVGAGTWRYTGALLAVANAGAAGDSSDVSGRRTGVQRPQDPAGWR